MPLARAEWIPWGDAGTDATLAMMASAVRAEYWSGPVRELATDIVADARAVGDEQLWAIRAFLARIVQFTADPRDKEGVYSPVALVTMYRRTDRLTVDCDDVAVLGVALAASIGFAVRFLAVGLTPEGPFRHVWGEAQGLAPDSSGIEPVVEFDVTRPWLRLPVEALHRPLLYPVIL